MGVCEQAVDNVNKAKSIIALYAQTKIEVIKVLSSQKNLLILDFLFNKPMFRLKDLMLSTGIESKATGHKYVKQLVDNGAVKVFHQGKGRKPTVYVFSDLLNIAEGKNIF